MAEPSGEMFDWLMEGQSTCSDSADFEGLLKLALTQCDFGYWLLGNNLPKLCQSAAPRTWPLILQSKPSIVFWNSPVLGISLRKVSHKAFVFSVTVFLRNQEK